MKAALGQFSYFKAVLMTEIFIKNMVCKCCIYVVKMELEKKGYHQVEVNLGVARFQEALNTEDRKSLSIRLQGYGLELFDSVRGRIVEKLKNIIVTKLNNQNHLSSKQNWPQYLTKQLNGEYEYDYLSRIFSSLEGMTLEQYIILQKIERVKEHLFQNELTLGEIAKKLGYSSLPHLSMQFKKVTGLTPSKFGRDRNKK